MSRIRPRIVPGLLSLLGGIAAGYVGVHVGLQGWLLAVVPLTGVLAGLLGVLLGGRHRAAAVLLVLIVGVIVVRVWLGPRVVACWGLALLAGTALAFAFRPDVAPDLRSQDRNT